MDYSDRIIVGNFIIINRVSPAICFAYYTLAKTELNVFPFNTLKYEKDAIQKFLRKSKKLEIKKEEKKIIETNFHEWVGILRDKDIVSINKAIRKLEEICKQKIYSFELILEEFEKDKEKIGRILNKRLNLLNQIDFKKILENNEKLTGVSYGKGSAYFYYHFLDNISCQSCKNKFIIGVYNLKNKKIFEKLLHHELRHILLEKTGWQKDKEIRNLLKKLTFPSEFYNYWGDKKTSIEEILNTVLDSIQFKINLRETFYYSKSARKIGKIFLKNFTKTKNIKKVIKITLQDIQLHN